MAQLLEYEQISNNTQDGAQFGLTSTDRVGFWGLTPIARPVTISTSNVSTIIGRSTSSAAVVVTTWGFQTQAEINIAITAVSTMQTTLKRLGIVASGVSPNLTASSSPFEVVDYDSTDGAQYGRASTELIAFYGATPVVRAVVSTANISTTTTVSASTVGDATVIWGWRTSSEFGMFCSAISTMQLQLKQLGLMV